MTYRSFVSILIGAAVLGLILGSGVFIGSLAADAMGLTHEVTRLLPIAGGVLLVFWLGKHPIPGRYGVEASQLVAAPVETVWDAIYPRTRYEHFSTTIDGISAVPGEPDTFRYSLAAAEDGASFITRIAESDHMNAFVLEVLGSDLNEELATKYQCAFYTFETVEDGMTLISIREEILDLSLIGFVILKASNPPRDYLLQLKAYCEGSMDQSYASWLMRL